MLTTLLGFCADAIKKAAVLAGAAIAAGLAALGLAALGVLLGISVRAVLAVILAGGVAAEGAQRLWYAWRLRRTRKGK